MKKLWRRVRKGSPSGAGEASPKSGSTRSSVASFNITYEVKEKDLSKLHKAAWKGDLNKVRQLAKKDPSPLDKENRTPLHLACMQGHEQIVQELLEWKAKANIGDNQLRTPLMWAIEFQNEGCVTMLLSFNVDIDTTDSQGNTPLHIAVLGASLNIVNTLIKHGANLNAKNKEGYAPLHMAVRNEHIDVCYLLCQAKSDVNVKDTYLRTPLMYACQAGSLNLVKMLLDFDADTTHKDSKGWTADDCAVIQGQHACSQLITEHNLKINQNTPLTTPRSSSQPPSLLTTPRDKNSIGLPALDAADDDSDETVSKVSGIHGTDSWADSPDVSVVDDAIKKGKAVLPKVSLAKFAQNIHISESDTDGESMRGTTPGGQPAPANANLGSTQVKGETTGTKSTNKISHQISWQSQTSGENSWADSSPQTPRKITAQKVSFKQEKEVRDIIESEIDPEVIATTRNTTNLTTITSTLKSSEKITQDTSDMGYVPSVAATGIVLPSADKIKGSQKPALMEELGISDVDDLSDMSEDVELSPPLPLTQPPTLTPADKTKEDSDWDSSVVSGYVTSPRPGILKKTIGAGELVNDKFVVSQQNQVRHLIQAGSGDESSAWDTTEADVAPKVASNLQLATSTAQPVQKQKDSVSEWDSDLEDMINPMSHPTVTGNLPSYQTAVLDHESYTKHLVMQTNVEDNIQNILAHNDSDWDSTVEASTPRANTNYYFSEVNVDRTTGAAQLAIEEHDDVVIDAATLKLEVSSTPLGGPRMQPNKEDNSESSWDSEADDLPSGAEALALYKPSLQVFGVAAHGSQDVSGTQPAEVESHDEDTETISSWEKERKMKRLIKNADAEKIKQKIVDGNNMEDRMREVEEEELARKKRKIMEEISADNSVQLGVEELSRLEEVERQWQEEESELKGDIDRQWEREDSQIMLSQNFLEMDSVLYQQQELDRINEQFQKERIEREMREEEEERQRKEQEGARDIRDVVGVDNFQPMMKSILRDETLTEEAKLVKVVEKNNLNSIVKSLPPVVPPKPAISLKSQQSNTSGVYSNTGSSAVQEIKQRLQVIPPNQPTQITSSGPLHPETNDDDEFSPLDSPADERLGIPKLYQTGLYNTHSFYRPNDPLDDDALSYTSTEFEEPLQSTPAYGRDREVLANINISDPTSLLKVQEYVRDSRLSLEQERNQNVVLDNKLKLHNKEMNELTKKLDNLTQLKSTLEQAKLDLEAKIRTLEYNITEETEKRKNAEILLSKTKEQLARKESQYSSELETKQKTELTMRNLQIEMRTATNTIKELEEEKEELQKQLSHSHSARLLQEQINEDQQKMLHQQQQMPKNVDYFESSMEFEGDSNKLKAELYALKMEMDRQRSRFKDEISLMGAENEELMSRVEELRSDIKLNEEALAHATMQYNIQMSTLRSDISASSSVIERERTAKEKLETEIESLKTRLLNANQEMDKAIQARNALERQVQKEKEALTHEMDKNEAEVTTLREKVQNLSQLLTATESKLSLIENELHVSNTSLMERSSHLQQLQQDLERQKTTYNTMEQNYKQEKEQNVKMETKLENLQEKYSQQQHENLAMRHQIDSLRLGSGNLPGSDANEKLNNILTNLRAESDRAKSSLEEKNSHLQEQVARMKEEVRGSETRRVTLEQDVRRLLDERNDLVKKLSHAEASLQIALKTKEQLEQDKVHLKMELEKLRQQHQTTHDKSVESQARISELVDRLEKAENTSLFSHQQLANTSANLQGLVKTKLDQDDSLQQLQIENARLEAELRFEKQRADMLHQDVQDSQKIRSNLEALCANLKSTSSHLEERLGLEYEFADSRLDIADLERNKQMSDSKLVEEKNRSNLSSEECKSLDAKLEAEIAKNKKLQKDVVTLKTHLKSAKNQVKQSNNYTDQHGDSNNFLGSSQTQQVNGDMRAELEAKYRRELNLKLESVNKFLDSQSQLRESLDSSRAEVEVRMFADRRRLEEEIHNLRVKYEQAVAQRETKEMEAKRFRELYESEMAWRLNVSDQLQMATQRGLNLKSKLNNERSHRMRLTGSIGNLNSSIVSNSFDLGRVSGFHDDELSNKIKAELDRSIAKHLEAAPHDQKLMLRPSKEEVRFSTSLTQSAHDYLDFLNRKYCV